MWIHEDIEAVISRHSQDLNGMLNPFFIISAWSSCLDRLPGEDVSDSIVTPLLQPGKVYMCIFLRERARMKVDVVSIEEIVRDMRREIWGAGILRIARQVDSSECYLTAMGIAELAIFNSKPQGHNVRSKV